MSKIQKGLSDADMLRGYVEEETKYFYDGNSTLSKKKKIAGGKVEAQLPQEQIERLNRFLTEIGIERMTKKLGAAAWQVSRVGDSVVIKAQSL